MDENHNKTSIDFADAKPYINNIAWAKGYHQIQTGSKYSKWIISETEREGLIDKNG